MESYTSLLEKTRVPQPSFQRFAVQSIFAKLRSSNYSLNSDSEPGRDAISYCLNSTFSAVVDQSVLEICRLVKDSYMDGSTGLLELQASLEGTDPKFVGAFIRGIGFIVRFGFQKHNGYWEFSSTETHPLVQVLSCRSEVQSELVQQVLVFMAQNKQLGMKEVCEFLRPLLNFAILRIPFSDSLSVSFAMQLISSMASFCCSFPSESLLIFNLLLECLKYFPVSDLQEFRKSILIFEPVVGAYTVALRFFTAKGLLIQEAQNCGVKFVEMILSLFTSLHKQPGQSEIALGPLKLLLFEQKYLGLHWTPQMSSIVHSLLLILIQSEIEHEQLSAAKLLLFMLEWKYENNSALCQASPAPVEELLFILPLLSLMSSPSKAVKGLATNLISILEKCLVSLKNVPTTEEGVPCLSTPGSMVFRLFQRLLCQDQDSLSSTFLPNSSSYDKTEGQAMYGISEPWVSQVRKYCLSIIDRQKSSLPLSQTQKVFIAEISPFLVAIVGVLVMHPSSSANATDAMASIGIMNPTLGVQLLLAILFYSNHLTRTNISCHDMLVKLLGLLPSLASHPVMIPLVVQTILPMLHKDAKSVLYATAVRLLCQTWEVNDRAFTSLHGFLLHKGLTESTQEIDVIISIAASIQDVCRRHPDRGVDLILSVSACIESQHQVVKALGLQGLAHLCEADAVDFYTAWDVISVSIKDYCADPKVAHSMCLLLKWGATDAQAYPEASKDVLQILLNVAVSAHPSHEIQWVKARTSAIGALIQYEVSHLESMIPDLKKRCMDLFFSEANADVISVMEDFLVKFIKHEYIHRRRLVKEKRVVLRNKIEKLLDVLPQTIFSSGKFNESRDLPGAALLCLPFNPKHRLEDVHAAYENETVEIAASIQLSRNIFVALITLQSWKIFMRRWMRAGILSFDTKLHSNFLDKTSKAAYDILKSLMRLAEEAIPRSAENMALAIGALCSVLPPSAHTVKSAASKFLLGWLFQHEHEHRQWPSAISLGLISSCLHVTDHKQRFQNITGLLEVTGSSRSSIVKGACGTGLGFSCQDLLTRTEAAADDVEKETEEVPEIELLGKILRALSTVICQLTHASHDPLECLNTFFPGNIYEMDVSRSSELSFENSCNLKEDIWGVAGLVLGLTSTITAVYRARSQEVVLKIKDIIVSWIPHVNPILQTTASPQQCEKVLSVGACLALPIVVAFCLKVELINDEELEYLLAAYKELISGLISVKSSGVLHPSLLTASCIGAGTLISFILNAGVHPIEAECIKDFLELFKKCYSSDYPPQILLGGMLGVVNTMGAGAGVLIDLHLPNSGMKFGHEQKESSFITSPLLSSSINELYLTTAVQELFLLAQNSEDNQQRQYAAWSVSFLRQHLFSKELQIVDTEVNNGEANVKPMSQSFSDDSVVMQLSSWLMKNIVAGNGAQIDTAIAILRCLSRAPRLPSLDWGAIVRRCMRYEPQIVGLLHRGSAIRIDLREESVQFAIAHANQFDALLSFLDELSDLSRFRTLEHGLQLCLLVHLADLVKLYSGSRLVKLFHDVTIYFSSFTSNQTDVPDEKCLLRTSCWKGLHKCLHEVSVESLDYMSHIKRCMQVLFTLLPTLASTRKQGNFLDEWSQAVRCLSIAPQNWLLDFLQVSQEELVQVGDIHHLVQKKVQVKSKLVKMGALPPTELGKLKSYILNSKSKGIWDILIEVVAALEHGDESIRRQWLIDAVEISCVSSYPSTALLFLGMLTSMCCKYMPLIIIDQQTVLMDLPVTLTSLLADSTWEIIAEAVTTNLFSSTERIYEWATSITSGENMRNPHPISNSENHMAAPLLRVLHHTCVLLKRNLPLEKQLRLAKMVVT